MSTVAKCTSRQVENLPHVLARSGTRQVENLSHVIVAAACALLAAGCADEPLPYTEVRRIDEKVAEWELESFLAVVDSLPDGRLPEFPPLFAPPPDWNHARTLPVGQLVNEELHAHNERWAVEGLARRQEPNRALQRALRHEQMTSEQFVGLTLALGLALSRTTLRDGQDLDRLIRTGEAAVQDLKRDRRPFSSLSPEGRHAVLQRAAWITRADRATRLKMVPAENVTLVRQHQERLRKIFPREFTTNPLDPVTDLLEEYGIPFEELPESGSDERLTWSREDAIVGEDER